MKKYLQFVKEDLEDIKNKIADQMQSEITDDKKLELEEKPNDKITQDIEKTIENFENQKNLINKKIETFNDEINLTQDDNIIKDLEEKVKNLEIELDKFDQMLKKSLEQKSTLENQK